MYWDRLGFRGNCCFWREICQCSHVTLPADGQGVWMRWEPHEEWEDLFATPSRKEHRKDRKIASRSDRSQNKKSDQDQQKKRRDSIANPLPAAAMRGRVLAITADGIAVDANGQLYLCALKGVVKQAHLRAKNLVALGDEVSFLPSSCIPLQGTILRIEPRRSFLARADHLSGVRQQLIAVNIDQVFITISVVQPVLKPALVDRYIIAAQKGDVIPIIVINKIDLFAPPPSSSTVATEAVIAERRIYDEFLNCYTQLGYLVLPVSSLTGEGLDTLRVAMEGKTSVFAGQSGVGKTSLINALTDHDLRVGHLVARTKKGAHTTSSSYLLSLEGGGVCIDTPGMRSFEIWDLHLEEIEAYFPEIFSIGHACRFPDCAHLQEPGCAIHLALAEGRISPLRFDSYCALMASLQEEHRRR